MKVHTIVTKKARKRRFRCQLSSVWLPPNFFFPGTDLLVHGSQCTTIVSDNLCLTFTSFLAKLMLFTCDSDCFGSNQRLKHSPKELNKRSLDASECERQLQRTSVGFETAENTLREPKTLIYSSLYPLPGTSFSWRGFPCA